MIHDGSCLDNKQQIFAPLWCNICFQQLDSCGGIVEYRGFSSLGEPRGSAHMTSFCSSESFMVGKTLPVEVSVPQVSIYER